MAVARVEVDGVPRGEEHLVALDDHLQRPFQDVVELLARVRVHGIGSLSGRGSTVMRKGSIRLVDEVEGEALVPVVAPAVHLDALARPGDRVHVQARLLPRDQGGEVDMEFARHLVEEARGDVGFPALVAAVGVTGMPSSCAQRLHRKLCNVTQAADSLRDLPDLLVSVPASRFLQGDRSHFKGKRGRVKERKRKPRARSRAKRWKRGRFYEESLGQTIGSGKGYTPILFRAAGIPRARCPGCRGRVPPRAALAAKARDVYNAPRVPETTEIMSDGNHR